MGILEITGASTGGDVRIPRTEPVFRTLKRRGYNPVDAVVDALKTAIRTGPLPPLPPPLSSNQ